MNFLNSLMKYLSLAPIVVAGVNQIHADKDSATKTQLAQEALQIAVMGAHQVLSPADQQIADEVAGFGNSVIVGIQAIHDKVTGKK